MQTWSIKPAEPVQGRIPLCGLDFVGGYRYFDGVRFFDERLDVDRLREALARTVTRYPILGGTLQQEDGRVFIDLDGPGLTFALESSAVACPSFGPGIPQISQPQLFLPKPTAPRRPGGPLEPVFGKPMLLLKLTRFSDGRFALGGSTCHMLSDAITIGTWFEDCYRYYSGREPGPAPVFSRDTLLQHGDMTAECPSARSGLELRERTVDEIKSLFFIARFASVNISPEESAVIDWIVGESGGTLFNRNDLLHALLMKSFAAVVPESEPNVAIDLVYDVRRIKSFGIPATYCGNAVLHRWFTLPRTEVLETPIESIAARIRAFGKSDPESARQDIGFLQREYLMNGLTDAGVLPRVQAPLGPGSLIVNNHSASPNTRVTFGGLALWTDLAINEPMPIRMAMLYPDLHGGMALMLVLAHEQVDRYVEAWRRCLNELTSARATIPPAMPAARVAVS